MSNGTWIQTVSGKHLDLLNPDPETIDIQDIAYSLSQLCRYTGHCKPFYSVAEHSVRVSQIVPSGDRLQALLHDSTEAYLQDISGPLKHLLPDYQRIEDNLLRVILWKWVTCYDAVVIKRADNIMLATEGRDLMGNTEDWGLIELPLSQRIMPWRSQYAESQFLKIFNEETR